MWDACQVRIQVRRQIAAAESGGGDAAAADGSPEADAIAAALDAIAHARRGAGRHGMRGPGHRMPGERSADGHDASWRSPDGHERHRLDEQDGRSHGRGHDHQHGHDHPQEDPLDRALGRGAGGPRGPRAMGARRLLMALAAASEPMSITRLGDAIGVDQPRASKLVQALADAGLVRRAPDPGDARRTVVELTTAGRRRFDAHRQARAAETLDALAGFTQAERAQLAALLTRLAASWTP